MFDSVSLSVITVMLISFAPFALLLAANHRKINRESAERARVRLLETAPTVLPYRPQFEVIEGGAERRIRPRRSVAEREIA